MRSDRRIRRKSSFSRNEENLVPLERSFNVLIRFFVYSSGFYFFSFMTADPDLWGHLKYGKDLWSAEAFQSVDIYSYTAAGSQWINHEWLSELMMYVAYSLLGSSGLLFGKLLIGFTIIFLLSRISLHRTCEPLAYAVVFILSVFVMSPGFMVRPQVTTFLFVAFFLYCFHLYLEKGKNFLWILPAVMAVWVNCHGGFLIGVGMFPVVAVCEYINCLARKKSVTHLKILTFWLTVTELAVLANPYGVHLLTFLYETLQIPRDISEWAPVGIADLSYMRFKILVLMFVCSFFIKNKSRRYWEVGIILVAMVYSFLHCRHTPVFAILAAPYLAEHVSLLLQRTRLLDKIKSSLNYAVLSVFLLLLVGYQLYVAGSKYVDAGCNIIVDTTNYPVHAVRFMRENGIKGDILLPFEWGEYAIWQLYPECRVSVDGRFRTVYSERLLSDHFRLTAGDMKLECLLDLYPPDIILGRQGPVYREFISNQKGWAYVYSDLTSMLFLKETSFGRNFISNLRHKKVPSPVNDGAPSYFFP